MMLGLDKAGIIYSLRERTKMDDQILLLSLVSHRYCFRSLGGLTINLISHFGFGG
jgi:hypothetical protein